MNLQIRHRISVIPVRKRVDIPEEALTALDDLGARRRLSRAKMIRQAVQEYLAKHRRGLADEAFGLWRDQSGDGLEYQRRLRAEW